MPIPFPDAQLVTFGAACRRMRFQVFRVSYGETSKAGPHSRHDYWDAWRRPVGGFLPPDACALLHFLNQHHQGFPLRAGKVGCRQENGITEVEGTALDESTEQNT